MKVREKFSQKGFTLPELLVTGGVFTVLVVLGATLVHPLDFGPEQRNAERMAGTAQLAQALNRYVEDKGSLPGGLSEEKHQLGTEEDMLDLCTILVPKYLKDMPLDPLAGGSYNEQICHPSEAAYITGYVVQLKGSTLTIEAPASENGEQVSITRKYPAEVKSLN